MLSFVILTGPDKHFFQHKNVITYLTVSLNMFLGAQMNRLIETFLLSTHNTCFVSEIRKNDF